MQDDQRMLSSFENHLYSKRLQTSLSVPMLEDLSHFRFQHSPLTEFEKPLMVLILRACPFFVTMKENISSGSSKMLLKLMMFEEVNPIETIATATGSFQNA